MGYSYFEVISLQTYKLFIINFFILLVWYFSHKDHKQLKDYILPLMAILIEIWIIHSTLATDWWFQLSFYLITALFLGSVCFAMVLGHYYLVVPKLSERPLLRMHYFIWFFLAASIAIFASEFLNSSTEKSSSTAINAFEWIVLAMRFLWGHIAILILSIFSYKLTKMRSIQSATGILYVMVFFILVGEVVSLYKFLS